MEGRKLIDMIIADTSPVGVQTDPEWCRMMGRPIDRQPALDASGDVIICKNDDIADIVRDVLGQD